MRSAGAGGGEAIGSAAIDWSVTVRRSGYSGGGRRGQNAYVTKMRRDIVERVPPVQERKARLVRILHADPDLGHRLDSPEAEIAARQTVGILDEIAPGPWVSASVTRGKCLFGGLVLDGLLVRELSVGGALTAELLG